MAEKSEAIIGELPLNYILANGTRRLRNVNKQNMIKLIFEPDFVNIVVTNRSFVLSLKSQNLLFKTSNFEVLNQCEIK